MKMYGIGNSGVELVLRVQRILSIYIRFKELCTGPYSHNKQADTRISLGGTYDYFAFEVGAVRCTSMV